MNTAEISYRGLNNSPVKRLFDNESRKNVVTNTDTRILTTSETPSPTKLHGDKQFFKFELDKTLSRTIHQAQDTNSGSYQRRKHRYVTQKGIPNILTVQTFSTFRKENTGELFDKT